MQNPLLISEKLNGFTFAHLHFSVWRTGLMQIIHETNAIQVFSLKPFAKNKKCNKEYFLQLNKLPDPIFQEIKYKCK